MIGLIRIVSVVGPALAEGRFFCQDISIHLFSIFFLSGERGSRVGTDVCRVRLLNEADITQSRCIRLHLEHAL